MATEIIITEKQSVIHEQEVVQKEVKPSRSEAVSKGMLAYLLWKTSTWRKRWISWKKLKTSCWNSKT